MVSKTDMIMRDMRKDVDVRERTLFITEPATKDV